MSIPEQEFRLVIGGTKVDYDLNKEKANQMSHGYSLGSAAFLVRRIIMPAAPRVPHMVSDAFDENGEVRHMHTTVDDCGDEVLIVTTLRPDETVRVISLRRASRKERELFRASTGHLAPPER